MHLPDSDGRSLFEVVQGLPRPPAVMAMSGYDMSDLERCPVISAVLPKPFRLETLRQQLAALSPAPQPAG